MGSIQGGVPLSRVNTSPDDDDDDDNDDDDDDDDDDDNDDDDIPLAVRHDKARKVGPTFSSFNPCLSILVIRCNRQHETVSKPKYSLKKQIWTLRFGIQWLRRQVLAF